MSQGFCVYVQALKSHAASRQLTAFFAALIKDTESPKSFYHLQWPWKYSSCVSAPARIRLSALVLEWSCFNMILLKGRKIYLLFKSRGGQDMKSITSIPA